MKIKLMGEKLKTTKKKFHLSQLYSVRNKLVGVFLIPVAFIVLLGIISYKTSSQNMIESYEKSSLTTMEMMSNYFTLGFKTVTAKTNQLITNDTIMKYYSGNYKDDSAIEMEKLKAIRNTLNSNAMFDNVVQDIYIFANYGTSTSTRAVIANNLYDIFKESEEGKAFIDSKNRFMWSGYHKYMDATNKSDDKEYGLALTYYLYNTSNKKIGLVVIDTKKDFLTNAMDNTNFGKGSIIGFVTNDGKELLSGDSPEGFSFAKTDFYKKYSSAEIKADDSTIKTDDKNPEIKGKTEYVTYQGKPYLYIYTPLVTEKVTVCALIPQKMITKQSDKMLGLTIVLVLVASLVAILIGTLFAASISRTIKKTNDVLRKTSKGDLTVTADLKRKDEFSQLAGGINNMISGMKDLISRMTQVSNTVALNSSEVTDNTALLLISTGDIAKTVEEIEQGAALQAQDAEECLNQMSTLSGHIEVVGEKTGNISNIADKTQTIVKQGTVIVDDLSDKAKNTADITRVVINDIKKLGQKSLAVNEIIETINYITEQTNLLSLNAAIEAARAGEFGKGFAVVADEIRKLAMQSQKSAGQIRDIIDDIVRQSDETAKTAAKAEKIVASQEDTLKDTVHVFSDISSHVDMLTDNLMQIIEGMNDINQAKEDALKAVSSITSTTQQTAAATEELGATAVNQMKSVEVLNNTANTMNNAVKDLEGSVAVFVTETSAKE